MYGVMKNVKKKRKNKLVEEMEIMFGIRKKKLYGNKYLERKIGDMVERERK
jgi:hypothetical protein